MSLSYSSILRSKKKTSHGSLRKSETVATADVPHYLGNPFLDKGHNVTLEIPPLQYDSVSIGACDVRCLFIRCLRSAAERLQRPPLPLLCRPWNREISKERSQKTNGARKGLLGSGWGSSRDPAKITCAAAKDFPPFLSSLQNKLSPPGMSSRAPAAPVSTIYSSLDSPKKNGGPVETPLLRNEIPFNFSRREMRHCLLDGSYPPTGVSPVPERRGATFTRTRTFSGSPAEWCMTFGGETDIWRKKLRDCSRERADGFLSPQKDRKAYANTTFKFHSPSGDLVFREWDLATVSPSGCARTGTCTTGSCII